MRFFFTATFITGIAMCVSAQNADTLVEKPPVVAPIPIEAFATDEAINFQMIVNKRFSGQSKFGFFSVVNLLDTYDNDRSKNEFMVLSMASYALFKGISLNAGLWTNRALGARATVAVSYTRVGKDFLVVCVPRVDLIQDHNVESVLIAEFFPMLSDNWGLYNRVQGLYNYNVEQEAHDRSYLYVRVGASYRMFRFGAGTNLDYYGPERIHHQSWGVFVGTLLF
jgi:hypothetical protein